MNEFGLVLIKADNYGASKNIAEDTVLGSCSDEFSPHYWVGNRTLLPWHQVGIPIFYHPDQ